MLGVIAVSMILGSYALGSIGVWTFDSRAYNVVQFVAGAISVAVLTQAHQWPYVALNVAWSAIAVVKLISMRGK